MIIFDLACSQDHPFEGWFQSAAAYEQQLEDGMISCPHCGSADVRRLPSAVHVGKAAPAPAPAAEAAPVSESDVLAAYQKLMSFIIANSEDVGSDFAEEARKIHYMEAPARSIRGEASTEEYEMLRDDGIEVLMLPTIKKESFEH
jgi:hypothetical protein